MEKIVEQGILYDFYGMLLNEHQRHIYEAAVYHDLSLSEIAEEAGISRQGVHDILKRCSRTLSEYEEKLHLAGRFGRVKAKVEEIKSLSRQGNLSQDAVSERIRQLAEEILEEL